MDARDCTKCWQTKPVTDFYIKDRKTGRTFSWCKVCHVKISNARYHRVKVLKGPQPKPTGKVCTGCGLTFSVETFPIQSETRQTRRAVCRDCHNIQNAAYKAANREKVRASGTRYYAENREIVNERIHRWQAEHRETLKAIHSKWKRENKDAVNASTHRRRNTIIINGGHWTAAEWQALKAEYDYRCLMCGRQEPEITLTVDHIIPVSQGGSNTIDNIQPLCKSDNSKKYRGVVDLRRKREP